MKLERLSCRERVERLCDYIDKELPPAQRKLIARHRRSCRPCAELLASLQRTVSTLRALKSGSKASSSSRAALRAALSKRPR